MNADAGLAQIVELERVRERAVGERRRGRAGARELRGQNRARTFGADMAREILDALAPRQRAAEQGDRDGVDDARLGHGDYGRRDIFVAQTGRELCKRPRLASHGPQLLARRLRGELRAAHTQAAARVLPELLGRVQIADGTRHGVEIEA
jgi:hypothetical protein